MNLRALDYVLIVLYLVLMAAATWAMVMVRDNTIESFSTPEAKAQWQDWREAVENDKANMGPVKRKVPKSDEPPTLVMLRDHFGACLFAMLVMATIMYLSIVIFAKGAFRKPVPLNAG